jgi:hypothetical protein
MLADEMPEMTDAVAKSRPLPRLRWPHEAPCPGPRPRQHRALPPPPGPLGRAPRACPSPRPALLPFRDPPDPVTTRRALLRHLSPDAASDASQYRRLPDGGQV